MHAKGTPVEGFWRLMENSFLGVLRMLNVNAEVGEKIWENHEGVHIRVPLLAWLSSCGFCFQDALDSWTFENSWHFGFQTDAYDNLVKQCFLSAPSLLQLRCTKIGQNESKIRHLDQKQISLAASWYREPVDTDMCWLLSLIIFQGNQCTQNQKPFIPAQFLLIFSFYFWMS